MGSRTSFLTSHATLLLLVACQEQNFTVRPGDVERTANPGIGPPLVSAPFEIALANPGEPSVLSLTGVGGACLVTQDTRSPGICEHESDCMVCDSSGYNCKVAGYTDVNGKRHEPGVGAYAYCLPYQNASLPKTCWLKPSQAHCKVPVGPGKYSTPKVTESEARAFLGADSKLSWRVVACVNGTEHACSKQAREVEGQPGARLELPGKEDPAVSSVPPLRPPLCPPWQQGNCH